MEIVEKICIDMLNQNSVSILKQKLLVADGINQQVGENWRCAYANSTDGRQQLSAEVPEPYLSAVMAVWGDTPTIKDILENTDNSSDTEAL